MIQDGAMRRWGGVHRTGFQEIWTHSILAPLQPVHFWTSIFSSVKWGLLSMTTSFVTKDSDMGTGHRCTVSGPGLWSLLCHSQLSDTASHSTFLGLFPHSQSQGLAQMNCFITFLFLPFFLPLNIYK